MYPAAIAAPGRDGFSEGDRGGLTLPIRRKAVDAGIFDRAELALLGRVFDQLKLIDDQSPDTQGRLAYRIIALHGRIKDEAELVSLSRQPLGR
ncbi:hypothetical protein AB6802_04515 [Mesorhizobium sp. RCC_202]|uniref:hypothetical protein n=1 Tax=Mesorhizobium sp. RCC_202 TaxID=3239222 RepID=UPI003523A231